MIGVVRRIVSTLEYKTLETSILKISFVQEIY